MNYYIYSKSLVGNKKLDEYGMETNAWIGFATDEEMHKLKSGGYLYLLGDTTDDVPDSYKIHSFLDSINEPVWMRENGIDAFLSFIEKQQVSKGFNAFGIVTEEGVLFEPLEYFDMYFRNAKVIEEEPLTSVENELNELRAKALLYDLSKKWTNGTMTNVLLRALEELR